MAKSTKERVASNQRVKATIVTKDPENLMHPIWTFDKIDTDGKFSFDPKRDDFDSDLFVEKLISYSSMTWQEILRQTHDESKSKNHYLSNLDCLSKEAWERINKKHFTRDKVENSLFSFALTNKIRVIGFRDGAEFQVVWYDADHEFAVSIKRNT